MSTTPGPVLQAQSPNVQSEPVAQATTSKRRRPAPPWVWVLQQRSIQLTLAGWVLIAIAVPLLAGPSLPFDRPVLAEQPVGTQIVNAHSLVLLALVVIAVANLVTPHRVVPDIASRAPARAIAAVEVGVLVTLGEDSRALGQVWHLPNAETLTTRQFIQRIARHAGMPVRVERTPRLVLSVVGLFNPTVRELVEMLYEFEEPFVVDDSKYVRTFGPGATPLDDALQHTVSWYRERLAGRGSGRSVFKLSQG